MECSIHSKCAKILLFFLAWIPLKIQPEAKAHVHINGLGSKPRKQEYRKDRKPVAGVVTIASDGMDYTEPHRELSEACLRIVSWMTTRGSISPSAVPDGSKMPFTPTLTLTPHFQVMKV